MALVELPRSRWKRKRLAKNASTSPATLAALIRDPDSRGDVRAEAVEAMALCAPWVEIAHFSRDFDAKTVARIGALLDGPKAVRVSGSTDPVATALEETGGMLPGDDVLPLLLQLLAHQRHSAIRQRVAGHDATPIASLRLLAEDPSFEVRYAVAANPATPRHILNILLSDLDNLTGTPDHFQQLDQIRMLDQIAKHTNTSENTLRDLAARGRRVAVASNRNCPSDLLTAMAAESWKSPGFGSNEDADVTHNDDAVLRAVASNPSTPAPLLRQLAQRAHRQHNQHLHECVERNPNVPSGIRSRAWHEQGAPEYLD